MKDDVIRLREQAERALRLASQIGDATAIIELKTYAAECEASASELEKARLKANGVASRF